MIKNRNNTIILAEFLGSFFLTYFIWQIFYQVNQNNFHKFSNLIFGLCYFSLNFIIMLTFSSSGVIMMNPFLTILNKIITLRYYSIIKTIISQILGSILAGLFLYIQSDLYYENINIITLWDKLFYDKNILSINYNYKFNNFEFFINSILCYFLVGFFYNIAIKKKYENKYISSLIISTTYLIIFITMIPYIGIFINPILVIGPSIFSLYFNLVSFVKIFIIPFIGLCLGVYISKFIYGEEGFENDIIEKEIKVEIDILKPNKVTFGL